MSIPVVVVTASSDYSILGSSDTPNAVSQGAAPFRTGPSDVWLVTARVSPGPLTMWHSIDNGATWATEDAANGPAHSQDLRHACWWDGARYLITLDFDVGASNSIQLRDFDTVTKTWGAAYATGGPLAGAPWPDAVFKRSDGKIAVLYAGRTDSRNYSTIWNGATWSTPTTFDDNTSGIGATSVATWLDSSDRIHCVLIFTSSILLAYQRINANQTLGPYIDLEANGLLFFNDSAHNATENFSITLDPTETKVVIAATTAAFTGGKPCLLVGTPLSGLATAGNWSLGAALDTLDHARYPLAYYDGTNPVLVSQHDSSAISNEPDSMYVGSGSPTTWEAVAFPGPPPHLLFPCLRVTSTEAMGAYGGWDADGIGFWRTDLGLTFGNEFR